MNTEIDLKKRIKELKREKEELSSQIINLVNEKTQLQEAKSYEYTERQRTFDVNLSLRRQLRDFYNLSVGMSLVFVLSDVFVDFGCLGIGEFCRGAGIIVIGVCAFLSFRVSRRNKEQINAISQEGKPYD